MRSLLKRWGQLVEFDHMTGDELKAARLRFGLTLEQMATMLGYQGAQRRQMQYDLETGRRPIREPQRRLIEAYLDGYRPRDWGQLPDENL